MRTGGWTGRDPTYAGSIGGRCRVLASRVLQDLVPRRDEILARYSMDALRHARFTVVHYNYRSHVDMLRNSPYK